jgi:hypothetical protein
VVVRFPLWRPFDGGRSTIDSIVNRIVRSTTVEPCLLQPFGSVLKRS